MTIRRAACVALAWLLLASLYVVSGFPPPLRLFSAELRRDRAVARSAKAGSRTVAAGQSISIHDPDVAIPMRDGVVLRADVLRPSAEGRFPTLVYRTPYSRRDALAEYTTFTRAVERGYAVVVQDVRGRYGSAGEFRPYENEGRDGYDTIEWAASQPWSNGRVGTFGLSYPGAVQWLAAVENPPHLEAMVPAMTFSTPQNFFYSGGIWDLSWIPWIWTSIADDARARTPQAGSTAREGAARWSAVKSGMLRTLPLDRLEDLRDIAPYYYDWLHHPPEDPFWNFAELRNKYGRTRAAVLNLSGWNDDNYGPEGAITNYLGLVESRRGTPARTALLIGPWVHGSDATARTKFGDRDFGRAAAIDYDAVVLDWMDRYVRDDAQATPVEGARYFVMGKGWKTADAWPPPGRASVFYLSPAGQKSTRGSLTAAASQGTQSPSTFVSNPDDPVTNQYESAGVHDYQALATRKDVLTFDSAPLDRDLEVTGPIRARIYLSCDCRDTDLWVRVLDVAPNGTAWNLMSPGIDAVRVSYRDLSKGRQPLSPGEVYEVELGNLVTSNLFLRGHRVRVQISSTFFPNFSRNLHTGDLETVSSRRQPATIRIHHDREHPSQVSLHVADR
jgi:putative CocE/NonD family hydrolase